MKSRVIVGGVVEKDSHTLLGRKPKDVGPFPNTWLILGGGIDLGKENSEEALKREMKEEAGIEVEIVERIGFDEDFEKNKHGELTHYIFLNFRTKHISGNIIPGDDISELKWVPIEKIKDYKLNRASKRLFKKIGYL